MTPKRALLVDLDGTLTDNFAGISRSIRHALAALGVPVVDDGALRSCVGPPLRTTFARLLDTSDAARIEAAIVAYRVRYTDIGWRENVPYDGAAEALAQLRRDGWSTYLCTSKPQPYAERIVSTFGLAPHFDNVYGADLDGLLDDKSKLIAHLVAREELDVRTCVMIGDREHDVRAARDNGARSIGVLWGYGTRDELERAGADALVEVPRELASTAAAFAQAASAPARRR